MFKYCVPYYKRKKIIIHVVVVIVVVMIIIIHIVLVVFVVFIGIVIVFDCVYERTSPHQEFWHRMQFSRAPKTENVVGLSFFRSFVHCFLSAMMCFCC